jgi:predicted nucleic acid-binding protein
MAEPVETPIGTITPEHFRPGHVRHQVVVGPKFLYALFNPKDQMHAVSRAFMTFVRDGDLPYRRLIVNDHIVDEAATRLKNRRRCGTPHRS